MAHMKQLVLAQALGLAERLAELDGLKNPIDTGDYAGAVITEQRAAELQDRYPGVVTMAMGAEGGLKAYGELLAMMADLPELDFAAVHALGDKFNRANNEGAYRVWIDLLRLWLSRLARNSAMGGVAGGSMIGAVAGEAELFHRLTSSVGLDRWVELWEKIGGLAMRAERVNLDRKQVVISAFMALQSTARQ